MKARGLFLLAVSLLLGWLAVEPSHAGYPTICVGCWYKFPNSKLDSSSALPGTIPAPGGSAYRTIFTAWGGGAFDPDSNRFLIHGGGHGDYSGNEVYSFSVDSSKWFRIKGPGSVVTFTGNNEYYDSPVDSQSPRSQHTKGRLQVCPDSSKFFVLGTMDMYSGAEASDGIHKLNLKTRLWSRPGKYPYDSGNGGSYTNGTYPISGYDSVTNRIWYHGMADNYGWLWSLNCANDSIASHGGIWTDDLTDLGTIGSGSGAVDVKRRRLYNFGQTRARYWGLTNPGTNSAHTSFTPTGSLRIYNATAPGLDYSYKDTTLVGYDGGDTVFTFNSVSNVWTAVPPSASNTVHPPASAQTNGTYGRFRYVKAGNFFIYIHSADSSVYAYRLSADAGGGSTPAFRHTLLGVGK